jgi:hypothetical protein
MSFTSSVRDQFIDPLQSVEHILSTEIVPVQECLKQFYFDTSIIPAAVHQNYITAIDDLGWGDMETIAKIADSCSYANVVDEYMYSKQRWDMLDVYGVFSVCSAGILKKEEEGVKTKTISISGFGTLWSKAHIHAQKIKNFNKMSIQRIMDHNNNNNQTPVYISHLSIEELSLFRGVLTDAIITKQKEKAIELARNLAGGQSQGVLTIIRLWSAKYTQAHHSHLKKWLAE